MTHPVNRRFVAACGVAVAFAALALSGCQNGTSAPSDAIVRAFNADVCSTEPSISYATGATDASFLSNVPYGSPTAYTGVQPSSTAPIYAEINGKSISTINAALNSNANYTEAVIGECGATGSLAPKLIQIQDNIPGAALGTNVAVRVVNLAPSTNAAYQSYDLYNGSTPVTQLSNVAYGGQSNNGTYYSISDSAGTPFDFVIYSHATGQPAPVSNASALAAHSLTDGQPYTIFLYGTPDGTVTNGQITAYVVNDVP